MHNQHVFWVLKVIVIYVFLILLLVSFKRCPPIPKNVHFHSHFCLNSLQPFNYYSSHISSLSFGSNLPRKHLSVLALICAQGLPKALVRTQTFLKIWSGRGVLALGYSAGKWMFDTLVLKVHLTPASGGDSTSLLRRPQHLSPSVSTSPFIPSWLSHFFKFLVISYSQRFCFLLYP